MVVEFFEVVLGGFRSFHALVTTVANIEFEFCKFTCMHLSRFDWFKNNQLLSELTHAHYREPVPLRLETLRHFGSG